MTIGEKLELLNRERGWTMAVLSRRSGVPRSTLKNMVDRGTAPSVRNLQRICSAYGIASDDFLRLGEPGAGAGAAAGPGIGDEEALKLWRSLDPEARETVGRLMALLDSRAG